MAASTSTARFFRNTAARRPFTGRLRTGRRKREFAPYSSMKDWTPGPSFSVKRRPLDLRRPRSEEHTSELQSQSNLVCRLLLEKKKNKDCRPDVNIPRV